jgi:phage-related protein
MSVLDDIKGKAESALQSLDDAETVVAKAKDEAEELAESAANHGWAGVADAMSSAEQSLGEVAGTISGAQGSIKDGLTGLSEITDEMSSDEVASRLGAIGQSFEGATGAVQQAQGGLDTAKDSAVQADATSVHQLIEEAEEKLESATTSLNAATSSIDTEQAEATSWGN